jgi:hypothetical protein
VSDSAIVILLAIGFAIFAFAVPLTEQFRGYCEQVARTTGRTDELLSRQHLDDSGNNTFEREQFWSLLTGGYKRFNDPNLVACGRRLAANLWAHLLSTVALVIGVGVADQLSL